MWLEILNVKGEHSIVGRRSPHSAAAAGWGLESGPLGRERPRGRGRLVKQHAHHALDATLRKDAGLTDTGRPHSNTSLPSHFTDEETEAQGVGSDFFVLNHTATTENPGCPLSGAVMSPEVFMWHGASPPPNVAGLSDSISLVEPGGQHSLTVSGWTRTAARPSRGATVISGSHCTFNSLPLYACPSVLPAGQEGWCPHGHTVPEPTSRRLSHEPDLPASPSACGPPSPPRHC